MEYAQFDTFSMSFVCEIQLMKLIIEYAQFSIFSLITAVTIQVMKYCQLPIFSWILPIYPFISSNEDKFSYDYLLDFIKIEAKTAPVAIMADGAKAITSSVLEKFPDSKRLICWYHAMTKMKDRLAGVKNLDASIYHKS